MRVLAFLTEPDVTKAILVHLGLSAQPPAMRPARAPPIPQDAEPTLGIEPEMWVADPGDEPGASDPEPDPDWPLG